MVIFVLLISLLLQEGNLYGLRLETTDGLEFDFSTLRKKKGNVFVTLLTDCPASQSYTHTLNKLHQQFSRDGISFTGVIPGTFADEAEMKNFVSTYRIRFPVVVDAGYDFCRLTHSKVAPECMLTDSTGKVIYSGRIDDWFYSIGKKRQVIRGRNLEQAIDDYLKGKKILKPRTDAIGCILDYSE